MERQLVVVQCTMTRPRVGRVTHFQAAVRVTWQLVSVPGQPESAARTGCSLWLIGSPEAAGCGGISLCDNS